MIGANQENNYYDMWALRTFDNWCDKDTLDKPQNNKKELCNYKKIPIDSGLIPVISCFGGTGIYKFKDTLGCKYSSYKQKYIDEICEHVPFHKEMTEKHGAKFFINPKMINS